MIIHLSKKWTLFSLVKELIQSKIGILNQSKICVVRQEENNNGVEPNFYLHLLLKELTMCINLHFRIHLLVFSIVKILIGIHQVPSLLHVMGSQSDANVTPSPRCMWSQPVLTTAGTGGSARYTVVVFEKLAYQRGHSYSVLREVLL